MAVQGGLKFRRPIIPCDLNLDVYLNLYPKIYTPPPIWTPGQPPRPRVQIFLWAFDPKGFLMERLDPQGSNYGGGGSITGDGVEAADGRPWTPLSIDIQERSH